MPLSLKQILLFFRVKDWWQFLGLILLGHAYAFESSILPTELVLSLTIACFCLAHGYSLNDIYDNNIKIKISKNKALLLWSIPMLLSILASLLFSKTMFYCVLLGNICSVFYSAPPLRLKNKLFLDLVFNSLPLSMLFILGTLTRSQNTVTSWPFSLIFFMYFFPIQLIHELNDHHADHTNRQTNTMQLLGPQNSTGLLYILFFIFAMLSYFLWHAKITTMGIFILNIAFAAISTCHIISKNLRQGIPRDLKKESRLISIGYGLSMLFLLIFHI